MKRLGNIWHKVISFDNLHSAYLKARKGKQDRPAVAAFTFELESNLLLLQRAMTNGRYHPGQYRQFIIRERKPRLISAAPFVDRVVHHAVMNVLEPVLESRFYYHSYACRKHKGVHKAVDQYQTWCQRYAYVLKVDIARYFPSINHAVLKLQLRRLIKDPSLLKLLDNIIESSPAGLNAKQLAETGLPIGNLTSQYFANLYLNDIDHWLKQVVKVPAYLRYVDDLIFFADNKKQLWDIKSRLDKKLEELGLSLHSKKQQLHRSNERIDVFGYLMSRERRWLRNDNGYRFQRGLKKKLARYQAGKVSWLDISCSVNSWVGHALHGETLGLRRKVFNS
jgi:Retron-type reverse transcriptase